MTIYKLYGELCNIDFDMTNESKSLSMTQPTVTVSQPTVTVTQSTVTVSQPTVTVIQPKVTVIQPKVTVINEKFLKIITARFTTNLIIYVKITSKSLNLKCLVVYTSLSTAQKCSLFQ